MSKHRVPATTGPKRRPKAPVTRRDPRPSISRNRMLAIALAGAGIVAAILIGVSVLGRDGGGTSSASTTTGELPTISAAGLARIENLPQKGLVLGNPKAKATIVEYADLQCPACAQFARSSLPTVAQTWIKSGKVKLEFRGLDFLGDDSTRALRFVHAAAAEDKGWSAIELLYANQGPENQGWVTDGMIRAVSRALGLDAQRMVAAATSTTYDAAIARAEEQAADDGANATPTFVIRNAKGDSTLIQGALPPEAFTAPLEAATS